MRDLVVVDAVSKEYAGVNAVTDVSLTVATGERLAVIGPNGAGKSTLFGMIAGEHRPTKGRVWFAGSDVTAWTPSKRASAGLSRTFQVARLFTSMTVRENVYMAALTGPGGVRIRPWDSRLRHRKVWQLVDEVLESTSLSPLADASAASLAQGARKTLEMAMAVAQQPVLLLLDEPTAGMSHEDALGAVQQLKKLVQDQPDLTIVLTAHDMEVVFALADRVVLMAGGRTVVDGTPAEVAADPRTREIYLGTSGSKEASL